MSTRKVFANMTISLDGRITGREGTGDMSWVVPHAGTEQARDGLVRMTASTTVLLGRGNYEGFGGYWPAVADQEDADPRDREFARYLDDVEKIVFSRTLRETSWKNSRLAEAGPVEVVRRLRAREGGDIWVMSSKSLLTQLLDAGEVDRLELQLAPELVGGGVRYLEDGIPAASWTLTAATPTDSGAVWLTYDREP